MCRECALILGGLRPKSKPRVFGSKKTVKERRAALSESREAPRYHGASFTFFDTNDDEPEFGLDDSSELIADEPEAADEPETEVPPLAAEQLQTNESAAIQRLTTIRRARRQKTEGDQQPVPGASDPTPSDEPAAVQPWAVPMPDGQDEQAGQPAFETAVYPFDTGEIEEPAEFRKPRPFVSGQHRAEPAEPEPPQLPEQPVGSNKPVGLHGPVGLAEPVGSAEPGQPTAAEPGATDLARESTEPARAHPDPNEPVHIHDDPWARTGPEVVSTAPLPKRRPDPKPIEDSSQSPPDWTKAKLPKFD